MHYTNKNLDKKEVQKKIFALIKNTLKLNSESGLSPEQTLLIWEGMELLKKDELNFEEFLDYHSSLTRSGLATMPSWE